MNILAYNKKLRERTYLKVNGNGRIKRKRLHKSKIAVTKRSQLIDSIDNQEYESIYKMDDFKSYNKSHSSEEDREFAMSKSINVNYTSVQHVKNPVYKITGSQNSTFKKSKQPLKNDQLQDFFRESNDGDGNSNL
jgi:hypothetical protein